MEWFEWLRWGALAVATPTVGTMAYRAARVIWDDMAGRWFEHQQRMLTLDHVATQNKLHDIRPFSPDERGRYPLLYGENGVLRDPNNLRAFTLKTVIAAYPQLERLDWTVKTLIAMQGVPSGSTRQVETLTESASTVIWPSMVDLVDLFRDRQPSIHDLVVGVRPGENGLETVSDSIHNLMHVLSVGASGWGKSSWLRAFLWQIAKAREPVEVVAVDVGGSEFNVMREWGKLRYPVARKADDAVAVLDAVIAEIGCRQALYEQHPLATKLTEFNEATGQDMPPWLVVVDEGTNLLHRKGIGDPLREMVQGARQYGIYVVLAGQTAKATVIDTEIRDQFSTRLCFHTSPPSSRTVLDDKAASELHTPGRAIAELFGQERMEVQGPWVTRRAFLDALIGGGPRVSSFPSHPPHKRKNATNEVQAAEILMRYRAGESVTRIAREVFRFGNSFYIGKVRAVVDDNNNDVDEIGEGGE